MSEVMFICQVSAVPEVMCSVTNAEKYMHVLCFRSLQNALECRETQLQNIANTEHNLSAVAIQTT